MEREIYGEIHEEKSTKICWIARETISMGPRAGRLSSSVCSVKCSYSRRQGGLL